MLPIDDLRRVLVTLPASQFDGVLYRAMAYRHIIGAPHTTLRYCDGAPRIGARFTPIGGARSLYVAEQWEVAAAEVTRLRICGSYPHTGTAADGAAPTVLFSARASIHAILDVTLPDVQRAIEIDPQELAASYRLAQNEGRPGWRRNCWARLRTRAARFKPSGTSREWCVTATRSWFSATPFAAPASCRCTIPTGTLQSDCQERGVSRPG